MHALPLSRRLFRVAIADCTPYNPTDWSPIMARETNRLMRTVHVFLLLLICFTAAILRAEPKADESEQATEHWHALAHGEIRYTVPDWWELKSTGENDLSAFYQTGDEVGSMTIGMTEQKVPIADTSGNR